MLKILESVNANEHVFPGANIAPLRALLVSLKAGYVLIIHAYFDESGTHRGAPVTCVAGYLFEAEQAIKFESEWKAALDAFGVKRFHMSECAHGKKEFESIPKPDRIEMVKRLVGIIKRRSRIGIVASIRDADYRQVVPSATADDGGAYVLCLLWCVAGVAAWAGKHGITGDISYFFESGHARAQTANDLMHKLARNEIVCDGALYNSHAFVRKDKFQGTQAADLLAWQWHAEWANRVSIPRRPRRLDFESLIKSPHMACHLTTTDLYQMAMSAHSGAPLPESVRRFDFVE